MMKPLFTMFLALAVTAVADQKGLENLLHDGNNKFTARMFTEVSNKNPEKSFVMSAFSVLTPLAQLSLASVGESHDELIKAIGMPNDNATKEVFSFVNTRLRSVKGVVLKTASKIYVANSYELNNEFRTTTKTFGSDVQNVDFTQAVNTAKEVNTWVEAQTNNRIKDLVDPDSLSGDTRALLVNAIYFKGLWDAQFEKSLTREKDFHVNKKDVVKVDMMYRRGNYRYTDSEDLKSQVIEIPYKGGETSLVVVLPHDIEGIKEVKEILKDPKVLDDALNQMYDTEVDLHFPKFKIESTTDLKDILQKMNLKKLFNPAEARLENLLNDVKSGLYIDSATQKAFIEVNEEGAEAAAANVFKIFTKVQYLNVQAPPVFNADRPFYFVLKTNTLSIMDGLMYKQ